MHIDDEVNARIAKASAAFGRLRGSVWDRSGIRRDIKLKVYRAVVMPTLFYACKTWTVYQKHAKRLNHFHTSCLRKVLKNIFCVCVCVEVLRPSQPSGVMSSVVSLPNNTFTGQA